VRRKTVVVEADWAVVGGKQVGGERELVRSITLWFESLDCPGDECSLEGVEVLRVVLSVVEYSMQYQS